MVTEPEDAPVTPTMPSLDETSASLLWALRRLGEEYGPMGVALTAAQLVGTDLVRQRLELLRAEGDRAGCSTK